MNNEVRDFDDELNAMLEAYENDHTEFKPSQYWIELNRKNVDQLRSSGFENFKQTVALNYFTSLAKFKDPQVRFLVRSLSPLQVAMDGFKALLAGKYKTFTLKQSITYNFVTYLLWHYVLQQGLGRELENIEEPAEGNPLSVRTGSGRSISQDLLHSLLEFGSVMRGIGDIKKVFGP